MGRHTSTFVPLWGGSAPGADTCRLGAVEVCGDLDLFACPALRQAVHEAVQHDCHRLVFDLTRVRFADSTALAVLHQMHARITRLGGTTACACAEPGVLRMLERGGVPGLMPVLPSQAEALAALPGQCAHPLHSIDPEPEAGA